MKLHLPKAILSALVLAMAPLSALAADIYNVGTITEGNKFPSSNYWTPETEDGSLTLNDGDWLGAIDADNNKLTSFGTQTWSYTGIFGIGRWTNSSKGTVTNNAKFTNLTINGTAQVVLGGQYKSTKVILGTTAGDMAEYTGIIADKVVVNGDGEVTSLNTWNMTVDTLEINSGKVNIHDKVQSGNNHFVYELADSKQVRIHKALNVNGGVTAININSLTANNNADDTHVFTGFGTINFDAPSYEGGSIEDADDASIVKAWINQTAGELTIQGKTASVGGLNIDQSGGTMNVSTRGDAYHSWHILSDFGDSIIKQSGDENTVLNIGGIAAYNSKYSEIKALMQDKGVVFDPTNQDASYKGETMDLNASVNIEQKGNGTITIHNGVDLNNYHENSAGLASTQVSTISQTAGGTINLNGVYKGANFSISQTGVGGDINLTGTMTTGANAITGKHLELTTAADLNISGTLKLGSNASINIAVADVLEGDAAAALVVQDGGVLSLTDSASITISDVAESVVLESIDLSQDGVSTFTIDLMSGINSSLLGSFTLTESEFSFELEPVSTYATDSIGSITTVTLITQGLQMGADGSTLQAVVQATVTTTTAAIPEPTTATLSLLALAGLAARRRRR